MKHLGKDLYLVPLANILFADDPTQSFYNPRYSIPGQEEGLDEETMSELYEGIRTEGLQNPPTVRRLDSLPADKFQLVRGERRVRTLHKLVEDNAKILCKNTDNNKWERPNKVYECVVCHVMDECDDLDAQKIAFSDNEQAVGIGEAATTAFVRNLKLAGRSDQEILTITGKKQSWFRDTIKVIQLDESTFNAFVTGEINRTIALELTEEANVPLRHEHLAEIKAHAMLRYQEKIVHAIEQVNIAEARLELAEVNVETAADPDEKQDAKSELEQAEALKRKKQEDLLKIKAIKPKGTSKDLKATKGRMTALTVSKIKNQWEHALNEILESNSFEEINERDVRLVLEICKAIRAGNLDIVGMLVAHHAS